MGPIVQRNLVVLSYLYGTQLLRVLLPVLP